MSNQHQQSLTWQKLRLNFLLINIGLLGNINWPLQKNQKNTELLLSGYTFAACHI